MQLWKWFLIIGLIFLVTYNPSSRTLSGYIEPQDVSTVTPATQAAREAGQINMLSDSRYAS